MTIGTTWQRILGTAYLVIGVALSLNVLVSGPHSIGSGVLGVAIVFMAGVVCVICGSWMLWKGMHSKTDANTSPAKPTNISDTSPKP